MHGIITSTALINALLVALANCLIHEDGGYAIRDVAVARDLLVQVFTGTEGQTLKISCIKFVRANTDMDLRVAKDFVEGYIFSGNATSFDSRVIERMKVARGIRKN